MRKFAGTCLALLLALLMPLTSMPISLAESFTSDPWGYQAQPNTNSFDAAAAKLEAIEDALKENAVEGAYVQVYIARVQRNPESSTTGVAIPTGEEFNYEIGFMLSPAPRYTDATGEPQPAYTQYEDVEITFTVPEGIVVLDANGEHRYPDPYTISLGDLSISAGALSRSVTVRARIDNNGTVANGTGFAPLKNVTITAGVSVEGVSVEGVTVDEQVTTVTRTFTYTLPDARNQSAVTSAASGDWMVTKEQTEISEGTDEVTITWVITAGKVVNKAITSSTSDYNAWGALKFESGSFTLSDTLPTITGKDGNTYLPKSSSLSATGMEKVTGGAGETTLSTHYYATTALTAGGVNTTIPYHTVYTVTATYDKAAFVLPFGEEEEEEVTYTNEVEMTYKLVGEEAETKTASAEGAEGYPTAGGTITVFEKLQLGTNGEVVEYNTFYQTYFPNGAEFDVYSEADWNNGAPAEDAKPVATLTVGTEAGATTTLAPGTYYVVQTSAPEDTETPANEGTFQTATVTSGGTVTRTFTNRVKYKGILEIDKVDASGAALPGAAFTLTASDGETTYPLGLDTNGHGVIALPAGTYTLEETTVPDGYIKMPNLEVTISEGAVNNTYTGDNALVNYSDKGTLTINKKLTDGEYEGAAGVDPSGKVSKDFTFNIYRSTTENFKIGEDTFHKSATIAAGQNSVTVPDLDVVDGNGNPYYYTVVEADDDDTRFVYDDAQIDFDFKGEGDGVYTTTATAEFTNVLLSTLSFKKEEKTLSGNKPMNGVTFDVRSGSADGTVVAEVTTANGGIATTEPLPIKDASGKTINYYIVETTVLEGYTTVYPEDDNADDNAWGPITLDFAETTNKTSPAIVNERHETGLTIQKTDQNGNAIAGATFTVKDEKGKFAAISDDAVTWQDTQATLTTNASGQIALSGIPNGTYTVTEVSVPDAYLPTGSVTGADEGTASTEGALSGSVTLDRLKQKTITFQNDKKPVLTFTKNVEGDVSGNFTFELYAANVAGTAPMGNPIGETITVQDGKSASVTVDAAGTYFLKEESWPAGVIAPTLIHKESSEGVYVDTTGVYYGPYTLSNNLTSTQTITNTPNSGSLTINKLDAKNTETKLTGATFTVSVDTTGWSEDLIKLLPKGFAKVGETAYAMTTGATNDNGQVTVGNLPIYNGDAPIEYTVTETQAPTGYLLNETPQSDITLNRQANGTYSNSVAFTNDPVATITITKEYYKQWDKDSNPDTYHTYKLANAELAIFEEGEDGYLKQVDGTSVQTTGANGQTTFTGLNGTKTYYVFELSNANRLVSEDGRELGVSVSNIVGETPEAALKEYYGVSINLNSAEVLNNAGSATLTNVEKYVQFTLDKYYIEEEQKLNLDGTPVLDEDGNKVWVDKNDEHIPLDRAKFVLCRTTADDLSGAGIRAGATYSKDGWIDALDGYLVSEYIYESGISTSEGAGPGRVVTGNLPASDESGTPYNYFLVEVESPAGFAAPVWPSNVAGPLQDGVSAAMEDHPLHGPGDPIRYVQVKLDKVARDKDLDEKNDASKDTKLANATFALYILGSDGSSKRLSTFTTGVDIPGTGYDAGRGVSESIEMRSLYYELGTDYVTPVYAEDGETILEYTATFQVVEIGYPDYTTPKEPSYTFTLTTNGAYDTITEGNLGEGQSADETMWDLTQQHGKFVNVISDGITVTLLKYGYSAETPYTAENPGWALDGAEITIYKDVNNNGTLDAADREAGSQTGVTVNGRVSFIVDPQARYFYEETEVPEGYESTADCSGEFTAPPRNNDPEAEQGENIVAKLHNVLYRKVTLTKVDSEGAPVAATFQINKSGAPVKVWLMNDAGELVESTVNTVATGADGKAEFYLPTGTYTVTETHVGGVALSQAEKDYFSIINDDTTFTIAATDTEKPLPFENPGRGGFTLTKTDDEDAVMSGVSFKLQFKQFTAADYASATTTADTGFGDLAVRVGATANGEALAATGDVIVTTDEYGKIDFEGLLPGWYKLIEQETAANEDYELSDDDTIVKVTATNFGANGSTEVTVINTRKGYLKVSKAYEGMTGFEDQTVTFDVYSDEKCTSKVGSFTVTGAGTATVVGADEGETTLTLDSGTYYVKESTTGTANWYTKYALTENATDFTWLGDDNSAAAVVEVTPGATATVYFTNGGNIAGLTFTKKGAQGDASASAPLADAEFALYYQSGNAKLYWNATSKQWVNSVESATKAISKADGTVTFANVQLPYGVVNGTVKDYAFYVQETKTPTGYAPAADTAVTLTAGQTTTLSDPIVNQKGVVITLTKYDKPYRVEEGRSTLDGAEFTLYRMNADGTQDTTFTPLSQTTGSDGAGAIRFDNLPQLTNGQYYAIQETKTPDGYLKDSLELYTVANGTDAQITAENGYFRVATDEDVTLEAYNTPLGKIAILKYDYINTGEKPVNATFTATNDENSNIHYNGTLRLANDSDEKILEGGYRLEGDHYVKDGVSYTIAYLTGVAPGTYTVVENTKPTGYLYTPKSDPGDPWHTTQTVPVENDGSTAVVVFANLPDPEDFAVNIDKSAEYLGEGDLLGEEYQTVKFTLSNFTSGTELPLETAVLKDETFTFKDKSGVAVAGVEWYVESVTIGAADYEDTAYAESASTETIYATVKVKDASGGWSEHGTYALDSAKTITFGANACQGIEIVYGNADGKLDAGFTAGEVVLTVKARQPVDDANTVPVAKIGNTASISMTYDFGTIGAQVGSGTKTKSDSASAEVTIDEAPALPQVSITKTSQVQALDGTPIEGETVSPGERLAYTITLTGVSGEMENPVLADILPAGLDVVANGLNATTTAANLTVVEVQQAGQNIWVTTSGKLAAGEKLALTILVDVLPTALIGGTELNNTAYVFNNTTVPKNANNPHGSSFADEGENGGELPAVDVPEAFASAASGGSGKALKAEAKNTVASASGITIAKMVSLDNVNWVSNEELLVAEKGGNIYYRVTVTNNGTRDITKLRILDVLPYDGDGRSMWGPTLVGEVNATNGTVYYSTNSLPEDAGTMSEETIQSEWKSTNPSGACAFLAVVDKLEKGASVTLTYTTKAPDTPDDKAYYQLAINTAHCMFYGGPNIPLSSADTKVTITPDKVSLGDRVWIDENADGIQDTNEDKVPGGTTTFTLYPYMEDDPQEQMHTTANAKGEYKFTGLTPAAPQDSAARYFSDSGDVDYTSLMGSARATYQLSVTVPDGYRITTPRKLPVDPVKSRSNSDSDFALTGETIKFYIPAGGRENGMDDTYDVGVIRERDLTITKKGTDGRYLAGAEFAIYGPYYDTTPTQITENELAGTITTGANGSGNFPPINDATYLNAYAYYVVVETSAPDNYSATNLTASGTSVVSDPKPAVTGAGIEDGNYFVLAPFKGDGMDGAASDTVTVTNGYEATGELVIKGTKVLTGETLKEGDYSFTIASDDDKDVTETVKNAADGSIAFTAIQYTYADVEYLESDEAASHGHAYHYTVTEVDGKKDGIVYDTTPREITVTLSDNDGDGEITVNVTVEVGEETSTNATGTAQLLFTNAAEGQLSVTKTVDSNVEGDKDKTINFTVELSNDDVDVVVDGTYKTTITENGATTPGTDLTVTDGKGTFTLKHGQTLTIGGIPNGTVYTVTEKDYKQDGFTTDPASASGTIATGGTATASFTNTHKVGGLTVAKTIDGNGKDAIEDFTFTVTLEHAELPVDNTYGGVKFEDTTSDEEGAPYTSVGTFTLKGGEQKALTGIPAGTKYTVEEDDYTAEGYVTDTPTNATGEITHGGNPTVTFKNTRKVGGLTVSKTVTGNDFDANKAFDITVTLTAPANVNLVGSYTGAQSDSINVAATQDGAATWTKTFSLKNGESIEFTGLPEGTAYAVSEADYSEEGYVPSVTGSESSTITTATATVAYTNTRDTGDLSVSKTVLGTGAETDRDFTFTLTLTNAAGVTVDNTYNTSAGTLTVTNGTAEFTLRGGETLTIYGLPAGTGYTVTETVPTADGYTVDSAAKSGTIAAGELVEATDTKVSFTNTRNVGGLTVTKETAGNGRDEPGVRTAFDITVTLIAPANVNLTGSYAGAESGNINVAATQTGATWSETFQLKHGESVAFTGLPENTEYEVSEAENGYSAEGFVAQIVDSGNGKITVTEGATEAPVQTVTVTNTRNVGGLTIAKNVTGSGSSANDTFTFRLELENDTVNVDGEYTMTYSDVEQPVLLGVNDGEAEITLHGGQTAFIAGIPLGTTYTVTELTVARDDAETGETDTNGYTLTTTNGLTGTITSTEGAAYQATFTNTRNVGGLTVTKKTTGNGLEEPGVRDTYEITVTLTPKAGVDLVGTVNGVALSADGTVTEGVWSKTFTLKANETVTFTGLPEGTAYTVSEEDYTEEGFITTITPQTGTIEVEDGATEAPTVEVTVTNTRNVGGLTIAKNVTGSGSSASDTFTFRLELENDTVNVDGEYTMTYSDNGTPVILGVTDGEAEITLHGGQTALIEGIPVNTDYTVTELTVAEEDAETGVADVNGYKLTTGNGLTGTITNTEDAYQASFTNDRKVGDLTVTKAVAGNGEDAPNALDAFEITVTFTAPTGVTLTGEVNGAPVQASNTITLKDGESVKFTGLPEGTTYEVTEADYAANGYEVTFDEYASGDIVARETAAVGIATTVTNTMNVGDLSVTKTVTGSGAETDREFSFTLTLTNEAGVTVDNTYETSEGTLTVTGGKATFTLKGGESLSIYGIPEGTDYTVAEDDYSANGYETTPTGDSSEIIAGETAQAEFTNHRDVGSLKITKEVEGNGEDAPNALTEFEVTVTLTAPTGVELVGTWKQGEASGKVASSNTFTLTDGESVELTGLPEGTSYTITEADYAANGYDSDIEPEKGEITDGASSVTVTNTLNVGDLSVLKTVTGSGAETESSFTFTLALENAAGVKVDNTYATSAGTLTVANGEATFTLKGGETLTIYGIPEGTDYTVTEADPAQHGYILTDKSGDDGTIGTGLSSATFTNTRDVGDLTIEKTVLGALGQTDKAFAFTLTLTPSGNGIAVDGTYDATLYTGETPQSTTITVEDGTAEFTLAHDQRLVIHEIPAGVTYEVAEESYALEGYETSASGETGTIPATGSMPVATFTNTRDGGSLRIVKNFAGNAQIPGDTFAFTIRLGRDDGVDVNGTYNALRNGVAEQITFTGGVATVWLTGGDTFEILGILSGTNYAVSEDIPASSGYMGFGENETGTIPAGLVETTFTNARYTGNLTVRKTVAGNAAETDRSFRFTIFLRNPDGTNANGTYPMTGRSAFITFVNGYASISLAAGETATVHGILSGAYYSVSEDDANTDGYVTTASGAAGIIPQVSSAVASFLNTRDVGTEETTTSRTVYKVWNDEGNADGLRPTELVVYLLADGVSIDAATLNEANGWSARFDNLPVYNAVGSQIEYQVVEAYTAEYYVRYQYAAAVINIINSHSPEEFVPDEPRDPNLLTLIEDYMVPLGGNVNMNEGDCFN